MPSESHRLSEEDHKLLKELRKARKDDCREAVHKAHHKKRSLGEKAADGVANVVGSWKFIIIQSAILTVWMIVNAIGWLYEWDPYPFILLNLALSFQAAFTAPVIMMSQNRASETDRRRAENDYHINRKAELEVEALHEKIDLLREQQISELIAIVRKLESSYQSTTK